MIEDEKIEVLSLVQSFEEPTISQKCGGWKTGAHYYGLMSEAHLIVGLSLVPSFEVQRIERTIVQPKIEEHCFLVLMFWDQNFGEQTNGSC